MAMELKEIGVQLTPHEFEKLCGIVFTKYGMAFNVISITRNETRATVVVELQSTEKETVEL
jgi:hypothetical protein